MCQITTLLFLLFLADPLLVGSFAYNTARTNCRRVSDGNGLSKIEISMWMDLRNQNFEAQTGVTALYQSSPESGSNDEPEVIFARTTIDQNSDASIEKKDDDKTSTKGGAVVTNTINERLLVELQEAEQKEKFGAKSAAGKKLGLVDGYGRTRKSDEEIKVAIAEARDLNGVNPLVAIGGSFFAFGVAAALWIATNKLGIYFTSHPPQTEVYFVIRTAQVFRNVVMGLISLASGFFGVTGLGIFLLGVRVAYGVMTGELDPTPIKQRTSQTKETVDISKMFDLMMNKKPGRRGGQKK